MTSPLRSATGYVLKVGKVDVPRCLNKVALCSFHNCGGTTRVP